jgi:hypothetical protein
MTREEEFLHIIRKAEEDTRLEWLAALPMSQWWEEFKENIVRPIFDDAVNALKNAGFSTASQLNKNGNGIFLQAGNPSLNLEFGLDGEYVRALSTADSVKPEMWDDRKLVTEDKVKEMVSRLLEHIARQRKRALLGRQ